MKNYLIKLSFSFFALYIFVAGQTNNYINDSDILNLYKKTNQNMIPWIYEIIPIRSPLKFDDSFTLFKHVNSSFSSSKYILHSLVGDTLRHFYTYDYKGNRLTDLTEIKVNDFWETSSKYIYNYDNHNKLLFLFIER